MTKINLVYQQKISKEVIKSVCEKLNLVYEVKILTEELKEKPPSQAFNKKRMQYNSNRLLKFFSIKFKVEGDDRVMILIDEDAYVPGLNFVFGEAMSYWGGIVYLARLKHPTYELYIDRIAKEIVHELGHSYGLSHCTNPRCVMKFSNSIYDTDYKTMFYCKSCRGILEAKGLGYILKSY